MKLALITSEPCVRRLPLALLAAAPGGVIVLVPMTLGGSDHVAYTDLYPAIMPLAFAWTMAFTFLPLRPKVRPFEEALPLTPGELLGNRCTALFLSLALPVVAIALVVFTLNRELALAGPFLGLMANLLALAGAGALLPFALRPRAASASVFELAGLVLGGVAALTMLSFAWSGAAYLALALTLYVRFRRGTPLAFKGGALPDGRKRESALELDFYGRSPLRLVLWRSTLLRPRSFVLLVGCLLCVAWARRVPVLAWMFVFQHPWYYARIGLNVLNGIDALPVSRARLVVPVLVPPLLALWAGVWLQRVVGPQRELFSLLSDEVRLDTLTAHRIGTDDEYANHVIGPASLWRLHLGSEPLTVTAPWGESARLDPHPIFWGLGVALVNPYDVEPTSSVRFLGWQLARAVEASTGARLGEEELLTPYTSRRTREEAKVVADLHTRNVWRDTPRLEQAGGRVAYLAVTLAWALTVAFVLRGSVPPATRTAWRWSIARRVLGIGAASGLFVAGFVILVEDRIVFPVLESLAERKLDALLGSSALGWLALQAGLVTLVLVAAARRLPRLEIPPAPKIGWRRQEASIF